MSKVYMAVTKDEYELPYAVADSQTELAKMLGVEPQSVRKAFFAIRHGKCTRTRYREVEIDNERPDKERRCDSNNRSYV